VSVTRTVKHSLFALAALAIAALTAHMVDCVFAADHSARITRVDAQAVEVVVARTEITGSSDGRGPLQTELPTLALLNGVEVWKLLSAVTQTSSISAPFELAASRNTSLAHRRSVVLVI
jgi:hypothetical protein